MENYNYISHECVTFILIQMKAVYNYLDDRKICHEKWHLYIVCGAVCSRGCTILYYVIT